MNRSGKPAGAVRMARRTACAALAATALALPGCYQSPKATVYQPGVYKGHKDPLLAKEQDPAHQRALRERFDLVQRDR